MTREPLAVCIGPLRLPGHSDVAAVHAALQHASHCLVMLTSAHVPRSPRNPLTWQERAQLVVAQLPAADRERVSFEPLREWASAPQQQRAIAQAAAALGVADISGLAMLRQDETTEAARLREALFGGVTPEEALAAVTPHLPETTASFLTRWMHTAASTQLREEWQQLEREKQAWSVAPYPVVLVTVDAVVRASGQVLLIRRGHAPGKGLWALPGGFLDVHETVLQSALRELAEETCLDFPELQAALRGVRVFDDPLRSQRGRVITHAHFFDLGEREPPAVRGGDDAAAAHWVPQQDLFSLEGCFLDDHFQILDSFLGLLQD
jgi:bifunctional NMN adenylyltransferase/nudix hydrolase